MEGIMKPSPSPFETAFEHAAIGMVVVGSDANALEVNAAFEQLSGFSDEQWRSRSLVDLVHQDDAAKLKDLLHQGGVYELRLLRHDGRLFWARVTASKAVEAQSIFTFEDISDRKRAQDELEYIFYYDALTGLPNQTMLKKHIETVINNTRHRLEPLSLAFIDLDRFKLVNDTLGHDAGDALLGIVTKRLKTCLRSTDLLARMGGDEFGILMLGDREYVTRVTRKVLESFNQPFYLNGHEVSISACMGVANFPSDAETTTDLIARADLAMFRAKETGRGRARFFASDHDHHELEILEFEAQLRRALERGEFEVFYQPQFHLGEERLIGFEALVRWHHPERGLVLPDRFIGLAEASGLIVQLGAQVLETACLQTAKWNKAGHDYKIAVNLSAVQLENTDLVDNVSKVLERTGLSPKHLELEVTESQVMSRDTTPENMMFEMRKLGVRFSIDDFGTGYSNLVRLQRLPLDMLKVDRAFTSGISANRNDAIPLVQTIIALAHNLGLEVLAEGVETQYQLEKLHFLGCDQAQGYVFAPPLPVGDATALIEKR
jgi:diguanylate cyclase (GGDEF)-like protein/PAS domain S-box-containing protein